MNLEEKLTKLRKSNALSQEQLADKINVTRQIISEWEQGQTKPDTENLGKIASIFGVSVNDLLDENMDLSNNNITGVKNNNLFKISALIIVLIVLLLVIGIISVNRFFNKIVNPVIQNPIAQTFGEFFNQISKIEQITDKIENFEESSNQKENLSDLFDQKIDLNNIIDQTDNFEEIASKYKPEIFNSTFKVLYYGSTKGSLMNSFIDVVIRSNEENPDNIITVSYDGALTSDSNELRGMKDKFSTSSSYEILYEYDENGFINKAIILR